MDSMVVFLYGMNWRRFVEEKWVRNTKTRHFLGKIEYWYWYQKVVPVPMLQRASGTGTTQTGTDTHWQRGTGTGTSQNGTGTTTSSSPVFAYFSPLSSVFIHR